MILNPIRLYKRHQRLRRDALDEAFLLRGLHGKAALQVARAKLSRQDLSSWGRQLLQETVRRLEKGV